MIITTRIKLKPLTMREARPHTNKQYIREGVFGLTGAVVRFFGKRVGNRIEAEAELQWKRAGESRQGKIVGNP